MYTPDEYLNRELAVICLMYILGSAAYIDKSAVAAAAIAVLIYACGIFLRVRSGSADDIRNNQNNKHKLFLKRLAVLALMPAAFFAGHFLIYAAESAAAEQVNGIVGTELCGYGTVTEKTTENSNSGGSGAGTAGSPVKCTYTVVPLLMRSDEKNIKTKYCFNIELYGAAGQKAVPGDTVYFEGRVKKFEGAKNPGGYSYRNYMKSEGIFWRMSGGKLVSVSEEEAALLAQEGRYSFGERIGASVYRHLYRLREIAAKRIGELFGERAALVCAMLLGDKDGLSDGEYEVYREAGIAHMLAVSGLHIGVTASAVAALFALIGRRRSIAAKVSAAAAVCLLLCLCGFSPSSVRAAFMMAFSAAAAAVLRKPDMITAVTFSAAAALIINPFLIYSAGFILSHYAVGVTGIVYGKLFACRAKAARGFVLPILYGAVMIPVTAALFNETACLGVIVNMAAAIPFQAAFIFAAAATAIGIPGVNPLASALAYLSELTMNIVEGVASKAAGLPICTAALPTVKLLWCFIIPFLCVGFVRTGALKAVMNHKSFWRKSRLYICTALAVTVTVICVNATVEYFAAPELKVTFLNVGYGDSAILEFKNGGTVIIDGGAANGSNPLLEYCTRRGIRKPSAVVLTHSHSDHYGGLPEILKRFGAEKLVLSGADTAGAVAALGGTGLDAGTGLVAGTGLSGGICGADNIISVCEGDSFEACGYTFEVLWPRCGSGGEQYALAADADSTDINNTSVVLRLKVCGKTLLFTGDIEREAEKQIVRQLEHEAEKQIETASQVDILKTAHHGSNTSTGDSFVRSTRPQIAVISVGANSYGHPSSEVTERLKESGCTVYTTQEEGAVVICIGRHGIYKEKRNN